jgi:hypothetical protein
VCVKLKGREESESECVSAYLLVCKRESVYVFKD